MKTSKIFKKVAILFCMATSLTFTSCDTDTITNLIGTLLNSDYVSLLTGTSTSEEKNYISANYVVTLSPAYYQFFDIKLVYTSSSTGEEVTSYATSDIDGWDNEAALSSAPKTYVYKVIAVPKSTTPSITESSYTFTSETAAYFYTYAESETIYTSSLDSTITGPSLNQTVTAANMKSFVTTEHELCNGSVTIEL